MLVILVSPIGLSSAAFGQQSAMALSSAAANSNGAATLALSLTNTGGVAPSGLQWTLGYAAADVSSVSISDGAAATSATKSVSCFSSGAAQMTCVLYGLTANPIGNGTVANVAVQLAAGSSATNIPISVTSLSATDATGSPIAASGSGGSVTRTAISATLNAIACNPVVLTGSASSSCTVTLTHAATAAVSVQLSSNSAAAAVPASVGIKAGASSASFAVATQKVNATTAAVITASLSGTTRSATLQVNPAPLWSLSGSAGAGPNGAGVTMFIHSFTTLQNHIALTRSDGSYVASGLANGMYSITPSKTGFAFTPASRTITISGASLSGQNFSNVKTATWSLSGNAGAGTMVAVRSLTTSQTQNVTANSTGTYAATGLANGSYLVTPSKAGYSFLPSSRTVSVSNANLGGINFTGTIAANSPSIGTDVKLSVDQNIASYNVSSAAFSTHAANELLLAFVASDASSGPNVSVSRISGAGLVWTLVSRTNRQQGTAEIWRAFAPAALKNVAVTATLSQSVVSSMTVMSFMGVSTSGTGGSGAIGAIGSGSASSGTPSATLTTTRDHSVVIGVGNDYDQAIGRTPAVDQALVHQRLSSTGDTYWVQMLKLPVPLKGTRVTMLDSAPFTDQFNMSVCEILPAGSN